LLSDAGFLLLRVSISTACLQGKSGDCPSMPRRGSNTLHCAAGVGSLTWGTNLILPGRRAPSGSAALFPEMYFLEVIVAYVRRIGK
jgi:hypothetical protein